MLLETKRRQRKLRESPVVAVQVWFAEEDWHQCWLCVRGSCDTIELLIPDSSAVATWRRDDKRLRKPNNVRINRALISSSVQLCEGCRDLVKARQNEAAYGLTAKFISKGEVGVPRKRGLRRN